MSRCQHGSPCPSLATRLYRPVSAQSWCISVLAGRPTFARPCEEVHRSTSLMSSSLLLKQCPACLVRLTLIVFLMGGKWRYICCFVRCCLQDLFSRACEMIFINKKDINLKDELISDVLLWTPSHGRAKVGWPARTYLVKFPPSCFSILLVSVHVVHPYSSMDMTAAWKKCVLLYRSGLTSIWPIVYR